jgi:DNA-binding NtrC family response regulator
MLQETVPASKIVLFGLADDLAAESRKVLAEQGHAVFSFPFVSAPHALILIEQLHADLVFCAAEPELYKTLLEAIKQKTSSLPFVVVSRQPDTSAWLDALQAGASDYCAPPFESISIRWILESALSSRRAAA